MQREALAFWLTRAGRRARSGGARSPRRRPDEVAVRTLRSAVSRGTESLVFGGRVPPQPARRDARALPGR